MINEASLRLSEPARSRLFDSSLYRPRRIDGILCAPRSAHALGPA